jgi:predicted acylesterase/phospholipase RssA
MRVSKRDRCVSDECIDEKSRGLEKFRVMRVLGSDEDRSDIGWIARHLTRTKLGLALGAGGAKGFAHVGVLGS